MKINQMIVKSTLSVVLINLLSACSGGSDEPEELTCRAPQVLNAAGNACVSPENSAPEITSVATISVAEGTANGTSIYTATATDADSDGITWSISDSQNILSIDSTTGEITITDSAKLIAADLNNYQVTITAQDDAASPLTDQLVISIDVTAVSSVAVPSIIPTDSQAVFYYQRSDGQYDDWKIHAWNNGTCDGYLDYASDGGTTWEAGLSHSGVDDNYGAYYLVDTKAGASCLNFILHSGNVKDPNDDDQMLQLETSRSAFIVSNVGIFLKPEDIESGNTDVKLTINGASAHWIDENTVLWNGTGSDLRLVYSLDGTLDNDFTTGTSVELSATTLTDAQKERVPHLVANWSAYTFTATTAEQKAMLRGQIALATYQDDKATAATYVQTAKALDALYTFGDNDADEVSDYGISYDGDKITVKVWAPTAQDVNLNVYNANKLLVESHDMNYDDVTGVWSFTTTEENYDRLFYRFKVKVYHPVAQAVVDTEATDPYSVNTSTNGRYSQFVNMDDDDLKPANWDSHTIPTVENIEDAVILETHIRDFSIFDNTTSEANRGKYLAFTETGTDANAYLENLADAGVTHFHMLPANDIATIEEDESKRIDLTNTVGELCARVSSAPVCGEEADSAVLLDVLESYDPATNDARDLINSLRGLDGFNWGYDPHHFNVIEGSYSSDPDGVARILEFREMVTSLHEKGMRVVLDVVYNHTSSSGLYDNSVFDKLVPGYYHRYSETTGEIERSTCCENTATEHRMMGKFVIDSLVHWAKHLGLDGFRFDIMGHMPLDVILDGRTAVAEIDPDTYFYGEGWDWGEVAGNRLFKQATQVNIANTEIGSFNDRPRDTIRGAALSKSSSNLSDIDHIRLGMAGTLQNYVLEDQNGTKKLGKHFSQSSYALDPADIINYISKHDNESLWDNLQYTGNIAADVDSETRVRIHSLSSAITMLSQGIPFFQLGIDKLRSKSMDRNTYDAGDWYNRVDYTNTSNNWNVGLPIEKSDSFDPAISANTNIAVSPAQIARSSSVFTEFVKIRQSSPLFRLTDEAQVVRRLGFHNTGADQIKGVIVMSIDDGIGVTDIDENHDAVVVVVNGTDNVVTPEVKSATGFTLHPVQMSSADTVVQTASFTESDGVGSFTVPAHTVAVFVKAQGNAQGEGLAADPDYVNSPYGDAEMVVTGLSSTASSLTYDDRGQYAVEATVDAGTLTFDVQSAAGDIELNFADVTIAADSIAVTAGSNDDFEVTITQAGTYSFGVNVVDATPVLSVHLINALVSCEMPVSAGAAPFTIKDDKLYVRGDHTGWGANADYELVYIGSNQYKAVADFNGSFQFKLASGDDNWETQLWAQNASGDIESADLAVGTTYDVAYKNAGTSNNSMTVTEGKYSFLLTLNEDNPASGEKVGTLLVEQCDN